MTTTPTPAEDGSAETLGRELLIGLFKDRPRTSYQPNGLPTIDETRHTPEVIESLQHRAMQID